MVSLHAGDAFAQLWDELVPRLDGAQTIEDWTRSDAYTAARSAVRSHCTVVDDEVGIDPTVLADPDPAHWLGLLAGLDTLFVLAAGGYPAVDPVVVALRRHYRGAGRFNHALPGLVVPRRTERGRDSVRADTFDQTLNTIRVSADTVARCIWVRVDPLQDHSPGLVELTIGQVPLALAGDLRRRGVETAGGTAAYELGPEPGLLARIPAAAAAMAGVDLGITAEATLDTTGLDAWRRTAAADAATWVLAGTGPVELASAPGASAPGSNQPLMDGSPVPVNRAVLLHGRSGTLIAVADKLRGYHISPGDLPTYGLPPDPRGRAEAIRAGTRVVIIDSSAGRFSILVCEDLDRLLEFGPVLKETGVSHVLNPVVAPELQKWRWQHLDGRSLHKETGARLVTANSLAVDRLNGTTGDAVPTLLVLEGLTDAETQLAANPGARTQAEDADAATARRGTIATAPLP